MDPRTRRRFYRSAGFVLLGLALLLMALTALDALLDAGWFRRSPLLVATGLGAVAVALISSHAEPRSREERDL